MYDTHQNSARIMSDTRHKMICWTPANVSCDKTAGTMAIVEHPDCTGASAPFMYHDLGCWEDALTCSDAELIQWILRIAVKAMMRDLLEPAEVHRALWALPEYRAAVKSSIEPPECVVVNLKKKN